MARRATLYRVRIRSRFSHDRDGFRECVCESEAAFRPGNAILAGVTRGRSRQKTRRLQLGSGSERAVALVGAGESDGVPLARKSRLFDADAALHWPAHPATLLL